MKKICILFIFCNLMQTLSAQLNIQSGTYWKTSGNVYTVLNDQHLINQGNFNQTEGTIKFTGNLSSAFESTTPVTLNNLEIAKSSASVAVQLFQHVNVSNEILFGQGILELGDFTIDLGSTGQLTNENEEGHITGKSGEVLFTTILNAPNAVNPGNLGAIISSSQNLGTITIQRGHQSQTISNDEGKSILRYFDIIPVNNIALDATLRFKYFNAELNGLDENNLVLWKSTDNTNWTNEGYNSRDIALNHVEKTGIPSFSRWTLSAEGVILPVRGLKLSGHWYSNTSKLDWVTLAEYNNRHFNIERKYSNENNFSVIGTKNSLHADGNSSSPSSYHWIDTATSGNGNIMYRLQQVDLDGNFSYSNIISIRPGISKLFVEKLYPTFGVQQSIYLQTGSLGLKQVEISLYDMRGRLHLKKKVNYESQWLKLPKLAAGVYQLRIVSGEWHYQSNFIKQ